MAVQDRENLIKFLKLAKELRMEEDKSFLRQRTEGQLLKFTNVMKGYQYRWFVVDPDNATIEYFEKPEHKYVSKPRGVVNLVYASICPSDEDSQTFTINAPNGDLLKLKASNAKERQYWINHLRAIAEFHAELADSMPSVCNYDDLNSLSSAKIPAPTSSAPVASEHPPSRSHAQNQATATTTTTTTHHATSIRSSHSSGGAASATKSATNDDSFLYNTVCHSHPPLPKSQLTELSSQLDLQTEIFCQTMDSSVIYNPENNAIFKSVLLSKATVQAASICLKRCIEMIELQTSINSNIFSNNAAQSPKSPTTNHNSSDLSGDHFSNLDSPVDFHDGSRNLWDFPPPIKGMEFNKIEFPNPDDEVKQADVSEENIQESVGEQKTVIMHLLSRLKIGMDLTKITLPTFTLERRSTLEMFADYMAHPDLFISITDGITPEERMVAFVKWYLTAFHAGHKDRVAKKPYNPIMGETFHCSWFVNSNRNVNSDKNDDVDVRDDDDHGVDEDEDVDDDDEEEEGDDDGDDVNEGGGGGEENQTRGNRYRKDYRSSDDPFPTDNNKIKRNKNINGPIGLRYCAEQVSHHPPVSAFYFVCPQRLMEMTGSIYPKSKFHGISLSAMMLGKIVLKLGEHRNEEYHFSLPTVHARSILSVPWAEFGDKIFINCPQTGYCASITFLTKPYYSDKVHRIEGEIFAPLSPPPYDGLHGTSINMNNLHSIIRISGEWNSKIRFFRSDNSLQKWTMDVNKLPVACKRVRPIHMQRPEESQRLWQNVTRALEDGDLDLATVKKMELEEQQRISEKCRANRRLPFPLNYFTMENNEWTLKSNVKKEIASKI